MKLSPTLYLLFIIPLVACVRPETQPIVKQVKKANPHYRIKRLHYENSSGERGVTTHVYNASGARTYSIWELLDGSRWSKNTYKMNRAGRMIEKNRVFSDGLTSKQTFSYDSAGHMLGETYQRSDGRTGTVQYFFSDDEMKETAVCKGLNGWFHGTIHYTLDEKGQRQAAVITRKGKTIGNITLEYNAAGKLETEIWRLGNWEQKFRKEYEPIHCLAPVTSNAYVSANCGWRVKRETYTFDGKVGGPSEYIYDKQGILSRKIFTRSDGVQTRTTYRYNDQNILLNSRRKFASGKTVLFSYLFNSNRQLVKRSWKDKNGKPGLEYYEYNTDGQLSHARYENMDGWLTGNLVFVHDRYGRLASAEFRGDNGTHATIRFVCNEHDLPIEIRWEFDSGHFQSYGFEYETVPQTWGK